MLTDFLLKDRRSVGVAGKPELSERDKTDDDGCELLEEFRFLGERRRGVEVSETAVAATLDGDE